MSGFSHLSPQERAKKYRELAHEARRQGALCPQALKEPYVAIADQWEALALDVEQRLAREAQKAGQPAETVRAAFKT